jgi:putative PIN family toxin of toxin-antitoxin system
LAQAGIIDLFISPAILQEVQEVLHRKFKWSGEQVDAVTANILSFSEVIEPEESLQVIAEDPSDDRILECAMAAEAAIIISGDRHLRKLNAFRGITIIGPSEVVRLHGGKRKPV